MPKLRNIIIFVAIGVVLVLVYIFFLKPAAPVAPLVSSSSALPSAQAVAADASNPGDFLNLLLGVKDIKLDDSIFSDPAFTSLHDSSITLTPDGTQGRPNPFAPLGSDVVATVSPPPAAATPTAPVIPANH